MRIFALTGGGLVAALFLSATPAAAQQNPFVPPSSGGLSKAQVQAIIRAEVARQAAQGGTTAAQPTPPNGGVATQMKGGGKPALPGSGAAAAVGALPAQGGGAPTGVSTATTAAGGRAAVDSNDPVAQLISGGGQFVGCVSATPVFKDKDGRRAYFTSKELKASNEAKRIARCG